ncbi:MAG TPA: hypothetical protein VGR45_10355 [Stellaceae bacterium]|nr:hypothetical protein [Stellaceae bacterium]
MLFKAGEFRAHSGGLLPWKIDCDALSTEELAALAGIVARKIKFGAVIGIPRGGLRFAQQLSRYRKAGEAALIVDDVLTTGASMERYRESSGDIGVVIFARGPCPDWVRPIFAVGDWVAG